MDFRLELWYNNYITKRKVDISMFALSYQFPIENIQNKSQFVTLPENRVLFFGKGRFDDFCLYIAKSVWNEQTQRFQTLCSVVKDEYYYTLVKRLFDRYGRQRIYDDILIGLYNRTAQTVDKSVLEVLQRRASEIQDVQDRQDFLESMYLIYYGMIAEENHRTAQGQAPVCGKVLKLFALYQYLILGMPLGTQQNPGACQCFVGKNPNQILQEASQVGIFRQVAVHYLI